MFDHVTQHDLKAAFLSAGYLVHKQPNTSCRVSLFTIQRLNLILLLFHMHVDLWSFSNSRDKTHKNQTNANVSERSIMRQTCNGSLKAVKLYFKGFMRILHEHTMFWQHETDFCFISSEVSRTKFGKKDDVMYFNQDLTTFEPESDDRWWFVW